MSSARAGKRAFTLLEIMLAVWIIALVGVSMFRFMDVNLQAIRLSTERGAREEAVRALRAVVQRQLNDLPPLQEGALLGDAHIFQDMPSDELTWKCEAGNGLFTENATGDYAVTMTVRRDTAARTSALSLRRVRIENSVSAVRAENWLDLISGVDGVEFRYFDSTRGEWVDRWADQTTRPALVRMRIWRDKDPAPYEAVLRVPLTQAPPTNG